MSPSNPPVKKLAPKAAVPAGSFMLRRVFRQGESYNCGICRRGHESVDEANECLESCWQAVLKRAPWVPVKRIGKLQYACIYCQRGYPKMVEATLCAENCLASMTVTSLDGRDLSAKKVKRTFAKPDGKPQVNFAFKIGGTNTYDPDADLAEFNAGKVDAAKATVSHAAPEVAPTIKNPKPAKEVAEKEPKEKRDLTKKFTREGSKYVCVTCSKKFFEKVEVEKCFDAHGDEAASPA